MNVEQETVQASDEPTTTIETEAPVTIGGDEGPEDDESEGEDADEDEGEDEE